MKTVITFGTFDVFHVGHLRLYNAPASWASGCWSAYRPTP